MSVSETLSVDAILGSEGRIARRLENYESREQQLEMSRMVAEALATDQHLIAEAGTGAASPRKSLRSTDTRLSTWMAVLSSGRSRIFHS